MTQSEPYQDGVSNQAQQMISNSAAKVDGEFGMGDWGRSLRIGADVVQYVLHALIAEAQSTRDSHVYVDRLVSLREAALRARQAATPATPTPEPEHDWEPMDAKAAHDTAMAVTGGGTRIMPNEGAIPEPFHFPDAFQYPTGQQTVSGSMPLFGARNVDDPDATVIRDYVPREGDTPAPAVDTPDTRG